MTARILTFPVALCIATLAIPARGQDSPAKLALNSGDSIVFIGNTFFERSQRYGHLETALELAAGPDVTGLKFRNLGWSGDSVFGDARSYFGAPKEGRDRLDKGISELKPNVLFFCYGTGAAMSEGTEWTFEKQVNSGDAAPTSFEGGLAAFLDGYGKLIDRSKAAAGEGLREIVLISPPPLENLGAPLPDQIENNKRLTRYRDAIRKLAKEKGARFVDLFAAMGGDRASGKITIPALTDNGIHYGDAGYEKIASALITGLGLTTPDGLVNDAVQEKVDELRDAIVKKNRTFFHRWRPANETYLFLFRKHEQGNNAKEIPMFDPIIEQQENEIGKLRTAVFEAAKKR